MLFVRSALLTLAAVPLAACRAQEPSTNLVLQAVAQLEAARSRVVETRYVGALGYEAPRLESIRVDSSDPCRLGFEVSDPAADQPATVWYGFESDDLSISTDFWGAGQDFSATVSRGGETGDHLSLLFVDRRSQQTALDALGDIRRICRDDTGGAN